jgi:transcriptional regulator with XRE-family HTH domain
MIRHYKLFGVGQASRLKLLADAYGSRKYLSEQTGLPQPKLNAILGGQHVPTINDLITLCSKLNIDLSDLLSLAGVSADDRLFETILSQVSKISDAQQEARVEIAAAMAQIQTTLTQSQAEIPAHTMSPQVERRDFNSNLHKAETAWGEALPSWIRLLAETADRFGQARTAALLGRSGGFVSRLIANDYPNAASYEARIVAALDVRSISEPVPAA